MVLAGDHAELCIGHADPGHIPGTMYLPAHRAMTMGAEERRQGEFKLYRPAEASPLDWSRVFCFHSYSPFLHFFHDFTRKIFNDAILRFE